MLVSAGSSDKFEPVLARSAMQLVGSQAMYRMRLVFFAILALGTAAAQAASYLIPPPGVDVIGEVKRIRTEYQDTFVDIARRYDVGYEELVQANPGVDPWLPGDGVELVIPTRYLLPNAPRKGIVFNIPEMRIYYYPPPSKGEQPVVMTFPVGIGREGWTTPLGRATVTAKQKDPIWYPTESVRAEHASEGDILPKAVPPGEDNPLGAYALRLSVPSILIHGTHKPAGVGLRVSHGCIRMFPEDIETLYKIVPIGTQVVVLDQPFKMGWESGALYLEVHPPLQEDTKRASKGLTAITELLVSTTGDREADVDWDAVETIFEQANGIPQPMSHEHGMRTAEARRGLDHWCGAGAAVQVCRRD
jgi:L,D-transpeptidase ErfK/SrfK